MTGRRSVGLREWLIRIALVAASSVAGLLLAEAGFRLFAPEASGYHDPRQLIEFDPVLGWRKRASVATRNVTSEYAVTERTNSFGLRGEEFPVEKPEGEIRILALGDSFTEGYTVDQTEVFTEPLRRRLHEALPQHPIRVINGGTTGYSTDQELLYLIRQGRRFEPDFVVLLFCDNDVLYNLRSRYWTSNKPLYGIAADGSLELTNVPLERPGARRLPLSVRVKAWFLKNSHVYRLVRDRIQGNPGLRALGRRLGFLEGAVGVPEDYRVWRRRTDEETEQAWRLTGDLLRELDRQVEALGAELIVFHVPFRPAVYTEEWDTMKGLWGVDEEDWDMNVTGRRLADIAGEAGIHYVDPLDAFRARALEVAAPSDRLYYRLDGHWTALGHDLVAEILADRILTLTTGAGN